MTDKTPPEKFESKEAGVGFKADVKTLQLLTSSAEAYKKKRRENQVESAMNSLGDAVRDFLEKEERDGSGDGKGGENKGKEKR